MDELIFKKVPKLKHQEAETRLLMFDRILNFLSFCCELGAQDAKVDVDLVGK